MNRLLASVVFTIFTVLASPASAASFSNCEVLEIVTAEGQNAHVRLSCIPTGIPPCAAGNPWVAFDKLTTDGKQWLALFMYALSINAKVTGYTYDSCAPFQGNVVLLAHLRITR